MIMKKLISTIAAMAIALGASTSAMAAFTDMPEGDMGAALQRAVDVKLMNGIDDSHIAPNDNITRAQFAVVICNYLGITESKTKFIKAKYSYNYLTELQAKISRAMSNKELPFATSSALMDTTNNIVVTVSKFYSITSAFICRYNMHTVR